MSHNTKRNINSTGEKNTEHPYHTDSPLQTRSSLLAHTCAVCTQRACKAADCASRITATQRFDHTEEDTQPSSAHTSLQEKAGQPLYPISLYTRCSIVLIHSENNSTAKICAAKKQQNQPISHTNIAADYDKFCDV